jgi:hypothetical protein
MADEQIIRDLLDAGPFGAAQDAIVARLKAAFPPGRFQHEIMPARVNEKVWRKLVKQPAFVGLGWVGFKPDEAAGQPLQGAARWTLYLVVKNGACEQAKLRGDRYAPGLLAMLRVGIATLHGWTIPDVGPASIAGTSHAFHPELDEEDIALHLVDVVVRMTIDDREALAALPDFLRLGEAWTFDPAGAGEPEQTLEVRA